MRNYPDFLDDRDGFEDRYASHSIICIREKKRKRRLLFPYAGSARVTIIRRCPTTALDANRSMSGVSEWGVRTRWARSARNAADDHSDGLKTLPRWNWHALWMLLRRSDHRLAYNSTHYAIESRLFTYIRRRNQSTKHCAMWLQAR